VSALSPSLRSALGRACRSRRPAIAGACGALLAAVSVALIFPALVFAEAADSPWPLFLLVLPLLGFGVSAWLIFGSLRAPYLAEGPTEGRKS